MKYEFEFVLLDRKTVNALIKTLHRPEPSGYGTVPGENMNVVWGVREKVTGIILTKGYEPDKAEWKGRKGLYRVEYDVMSKDGCFGVSFETDINGGNIDAARAFWQNSAAIEKRYLETIKEGIFFYEKGGNKNGDFEKFCTEFEKTHKMSVDSYQKQAYEEIYDEWKNKWR